MSTELFQRVMKWADGDERGGALMRRVWEPTPWMVIAFTGSLSSPGDRYESMREWCLEQFGQECYVIHEKEGDWQRGGATAYGWTWFGFAREDQLNQFLDRWKDEEWIQAESKRPCSNSV